jgi:hypothetical protein
LGNLRAIQLDSSLSYRVDLDWDFVGPENIDLFQSQGLVRAMVFADAQEPSLFLLNEYAAQYLGLEFLRAGAGHATLQDTMSRHYVAGDVRDAIGTGSFNSEVSLSFYHFYEALAGGVTSARRDQAGTLTINGSYTYIYDAVPEPAAWAAMVSGFIVVGAALRFRSRRQSDRAVASA